MSTMIQPPKYTTYSKGQQTNSQSNYVVIKIVEVFSCWFFFFPSGFAKRRKRYFKCWFELVTLFKYMTVWASTSIEISTNWQWWYTFVVKIAGQCAWFQLACLAVTVVYMVCVAWLCGGTRTVCGKLCGTCIPQCGGLCGQCPCAGLCGSYHSMMSTM